MPTDSFPDQVNVSPIRPVESATADLAEFEAAFGEPFSKTLDLSTWTAGEDLAAAYARLEQEVSDAVAQEERYKAVIRETIFPKLGKLPRAPKNAGLHSVARSDLERVHQGLLFNGGVEACDGTNVVHDTLPLSITQIGICLVSYSGEQGAWVHRLFRRDLRNKQENPIDEVMTVLDKRQNERARGSAAIV